MDHQRIITSLYLVINSVKLGENDSVDEARVCHVGVVGQGLVELGQLIHGLIPHQRLPHKQNQVRLVHFYQL